MTHSDNGFTLIELLAAITIIGVLLAIAIPVFSEYKDRSFDARASNNLRNTVIAQEAHYIENRQFTVNLADLGEAFPDSGEVVMGLSEFGDRLATAWSGYAYHNSGTTTYCYNTLQNKITAVAGIGHQASCP